MPSDDETLLNVLLVSLAGEVYALPSASVREIVRYRSFTHVPGAPPTLPGIISQRGAILPVVELRPLLGLPEAELHRGARLVIAQHNEIDMAILVEVVLDLVAIPEASIEPPHPALDPKRSRFIRGIARHDDQPVAILNFDTVIAALREDQ